MSVYLLVAILKKRLDLDAGRYTILQVLSLTIFENTPLLQILTESKRNRGKSPGGQGGWARWRMRCGRKGTLGASGTAKRLPR